MICPCGPVSLEGRGLVVEEQILPVHIIGIGGLEKETRFTSYSLRAICRHVGRTHSNCSDSTLLP